MIVGVDSIFGHFIFVGWVEPILGYVGFRFTQSNLHFVSSIVQCETQQWPILEPSPDGRISKDCILSSFIKRWSEVIPSFDIRHSSFVVFLRASRRDFIFGN